MSKRDEGVSEDRDMYSLKYLTATHSSPFEEKITDENGLPLRKRHKTEFPPPSNSLYSIMNFSTENHYNKDETQNKDWPSSFQEISQNNNIPSVSSIFDNSFGNLPFGTQGILPRPRLPGLENTQKFTPFLLPNPNSYYNPLDPPRSSSNSSFSIAPMYPPQFSTDPQISNSQTDIQHLLLKQHSLQDSKVNAPSIQVFSRGESGQAATLSPSTIHFPLSDSPNKIFKRSSERTVINKSNTSTEVIGGGGPPLITTENQNTTNRFILIEQPNDIQRKSYKKENRCLLPNPLIICMKELTEDQKKEPPIVLDGVVSLKLVNNDGSELPPHKSNALESIEGGLTHPLGDDYTTCFSVKVLQTSEGNLFRLIFNVSYRLKGQGRMEEQIISRPFAVYSNKHNRNSRKKQKKAEESGSVLLL